MRLLLVLALAGAAGAADSNKTFTIISPNVDLFLGKAPPEFWDVFGVASLVLGVVFALFGLYLLRTQVSFYSGCAVGGLAAYLLSLVPTENDKGVSGELWLGVVLSVGVLGGYLLGRLVGTRGVVLWLALTAALAALFNQYLLSYFDSFPEWVPWVVYAAACAVSGLLLWWYSRFAVILSTSFLGSFLVLLSSALLMDGEFSLVSQHCKSLTTLTHHPVGHVWRQSHLARGVHHGRVLGTARDWPGDVWDWAEVPAVPPAEEGRAGGHDASGALAVLRRLAGGRGGRYRQPVCADQVPQATRGGGGGH